MTWWHKTRTFLSHNRRIIYWIPPLALFNAQVGSITYISGRSMQPSFNPDSSYVPDIVLLDRLSGSSLFTWYGGYFNWRPSFERGDIVVLRSPVDPSRRLVKRIVGVENDIVRTLPPFPQQTTQVPVGHVWVEGDEPFVSHDSNRFGPISTGLIEAKINYIIWPLSRIGRVAPAPARHKDRVFTFSDLIKRSAGGSGTIVRLDDKPSPAQQNLSAASTP